jgi:flagellar export protein FliJ
MKRFHWSLQRLLDLTVQREQAIRAELSELMTRIARTVSDIRQWRSFLQELLDGLDGEAFAARIDRQQVFFDYSPTIEKRIEALGRRRDQLESQRQSKIEQFREVHSSRETLERLRAEAERRHRQDQERREQREVDDRNNMAYARKTLAGQD